jgi:hypothetical protein
MIKYLMALTSSFVFCLGNAPLASAHDTHSHSHSYRDSEIYKVQYAGSFMKEIACAVALKKLSKEEGHIAIRGVFAQNNIPQQWVKRPDVLSIAHDDLKREGCYN